MFTKEELENDSHFVDFASRMLTHNRYKVGRFIKIDTLSVLIKKISKAHFEEIKHFPKRDLYLIRTNDIGLGYSSYLSPVRLYELMELGKVPKDIPIEFKYQHNNVFTYIDIVNIDPKLLLTDEVYFILHKPTNKIYLAVIGKPTSPNKLYYRSDLDGFKSTLDKAKTIQNFNRIDIYEEIIVDFI